MPGHSLRRASHIGGGLCCRWTCRDYEAEAFSEHLKRSVCPGGNRDAAAGAVRREGCRECRAFQAELYLVRALVRRRIWDNQKAKRYGRAIPGRNRARLLDPPTRYDFTTCSPIEAYRLDRFGQREHDLADFGWHGGLR